jgi:hypothetical protein
MIYNLNDIHRPNNDLPIQEDNQESVSESDKLSIMVNTSADTPLVYSLDELTHTVSHLPPTSSPSGYIPIEIDAGSGNVSRNTIVNNNNLNSFYSIN